MAIFASFVAVTTFAGPAMAQNTYSVSAYTTLIEPLTITKLEDMDFGDIAGTSGGTIVLTPTVTPTCTATGGLVRTNACVPAVFGGAGPTNQRVRIRRPIGNTITLTGPGADMVVTDITFNADPTLTHVQSNPNWERFRIISPDGIFIFRVGGTLNVNANQTPGTYTGTYSIRLDYQ